MNLEEIYDDFIQMCNASYRFCYVISYIYDEQVAVYTDDKEGCYDLFTRLKPYFSIKESDQHRNYSIYQKKIDADSDLWMQLQEKFLESGEEIVAHKGNSTEQLRKYKIIRTSWFNLYQSEDRGTIICVINKKLLLLARDIKKISKETRRILKDVIISRLVEKNNGIIFHCAIAEKDQQGIVIMGAKGSGKTGTLIRQILNGANFVTSDRGYYNYDTGYIYGWPEPMNITKEIIGILNLEIEANLFDSKDNGKLAVPYNNIPRVFDTNIVNGCKVRYIIFPVLESNKNSSCRKLSSDEMYARVCENCLSPNDEEHPDWLELIHIDLDNYMMVRNNIIDKMSRECIGIELSIGHDSNEQKCLEKYLI